MDFDLTDEQQAIRRLARDFAEGEVKPVAEELIGRSGSRTRSSQAGRARPMGIPYPEEYGGGGADNLSYALAIEELTRVDSSVAITVAAHTSLGTWPIYAFGSDEQKKSGCRGCARARGSAPSASPSPRPAPTPATPAPAPRATNGHWVINGAKQFITNAAPKSAASSRSPPGRARTRLQPARPERHARLRDRRALPQDGLERLRHAAARLRGLPRARGEPRRAPGAGLQAVPQTLDGGRIGVRPWAWGLAQGALDEALEYAKERMAFGQPISKYQAIQAKLADMATEIEAARLLTYKAALEKDAGNSFSLTAAQAKLRPAGWPCKASEEAVQIHGGYGYIEEYPVCRFYRDAKILTIGEGTDEVQQMVIARALGRSAHPWLLIEPRQPRQIGEILHPSPRLLHAPQVQERADAHGHPEEVAVTESRSSSG